MLKAMALCAQAEWWGRKSGHVLDLATAIELKEKPQAGSVKVYRVVSDLE